MEAQLRQLVAATLGTPYVYGGADVDGFDCSGLVHWLRGRLGVPPGPRTAEGQRQAALRKGALAPATASTAWRFGDLLFSANEPGGLAHHVAVATGEPAAAGAVWVVDAPSKGGQVARHSRRQQANDYYAAREAAWT